jgi:hypothetical protein
MLLQFIKQSARSAWQALGAAGAASAVKTETKIDDVLVTKVFGDDEVFEAFWAELEKRLGWPGGGTPPTPAGAETRPVWPVKP